MNSSALPDIVSIKKNVEIKELLANAKKIHTRYGLFFLSRESFSNQIGFAVLIKKSVGNAVRRNYYKRIVRSYFRNNLKLFAGYGKILFLFNYEGKITFQDLTKEFDNRLHTI